MSLVRSMYVSLCKEVIDITGKKIKRKGVIVLTCFLKCSLRVELCYENKKKTNLKLKTLKGVAMMEVEHYGGDDDGFVM